MRKTERAAGILGFSDHGPIDARIHRVHLSIPLKRGDVLRARCLALHASAKLKRAPLRERSFPAMTPVIVRKPARAVRVARIDLDAGRVPHRSAVSRLSAVRTVRISPLCLSVTS